MRVAIISDTHIPSRAAEMPPWVREIVGAADHTIHAGDFDSEAAYETVEELADGNLTAVRGNMDRLDLPETATVRLEGQPFVVTHGTGDRTGYQDRVVETVVAENPDAIGVCGHTHEHMDERVRGIRLLNPGSATGAEPTGVTSVMTVQIEEDDIEVTLHTDE